MSRLGNVRDFELLKFLGKGTFGAVYQARRAEDKKIYAIKKVDTRRMSTKERTESVNEIRVLASISGPHVITFFEAFVDADILYIVTEFATHGDLLGYLKNAKRSGQLPEATVWPLFIQMCLGVQSLHDKNILHRGLFLRVKQTGGDRKCRCCGLADERFAHLAMCCMIRPFVWRQSI